MKGLNQIYAEIDAINILSRGHKRSIEVAVCPYCSRTIDEDPGDGRVPMCCNKAQKVYFSILSQMGYTFDHKRDTAQ